MTSNLISREEARSCLNPTIAVTNATMRDYVDDRN